MDVAQEVRCKGRQSKRSLRTSQLTAGSEVADTFDLMSTAKVTDIPPPQKQTQRHRDQCVAVDAGASEERQEKG